MLACRSGISIRSGLNGMANARTTLEHVMQVSFRFFPMREILQETVIHPGMVDTKRMKKHLRSKRQWSTLHTDARWLKLARSHHKREMVMPTLNGTTKALNQIMLVLCKVRQIHLGPLTPVAHLGIDIKRKTHFVSNILQNANNRSNS